MEVEVPVPVPVAVAADVVDVEVLDLCAASAWAIRLALGAFEALSTMEKSLTPWDDRWAVPPKRWREKTGVTYIKLRAANLSLLATVPKISDREERTNVTTVLKSWHRRWRIN